MKKKFSFIMILLLATIMNIYHVYSYEREDTTMNSYSYYLKTRPASNKTDYSNGLTLAKVLEIRDHVETLIDEAESGLYDVDINLARQKLADIDQMLIGLTESNYEAYYQIYEDLFSIYSYTVESRVIEGRGFWHRPYEKSLSEVQATLEEMQNMNVNMLYVETFWQGYLIYDSEIPETYQHGFTKYADYGEYGNNLLKAFVEEGKKYGIEVHAWVENFFVGAGSSIYNSPILKEHPEWTLYNYDGSVTQKLEGGPYLFMDPANPEVRTYLKNIYKEIANTTDVASIHLDYIRYPVVNGTISFDNGYSEYSNREFNYLYGYEGDLRDLLDRSQNPDYVDVYNDWKQYKTDVISDFVAGVYYEVKNASPNVYLSTAIFGDPTHAVNQKMQDWARWSSEGYIELILPMAYAKSTGSVASEVSRLTQIVGNNAFSYTGIAPSFMGYNDHLNTFQIQASIASGAQGTTIFASQMYLIEKGVFNEKAQNILHEGIWRKDTVLPHDEIKTVIDTQLNYIIDKANRLYLPNNAMTAQNVLDLETEFERIKAMPMTTAIELHNIYTELEGINPNDYSENPATKRIIEDMTYLKKLVKLRYSRMDIDDSIDLSTNPDTDPTLPPVEVSCEEDPTQEKCQVQEPTCEEDPTQEKCQVQEPTCEEDPTQEKCQVQEPTCEEDPTQDKCIVPDEPKKKYTLLIFGGIVVIVASLVGGLFLILKNKS